MLSPEMIVISQELEVTPGWASLSAYDRAKLACEALTRAGIEPPAWVSLREMIGKGSAGDIQRAKTDFRREHGARLREMERLQMEGVPQSLAPMVLGLWREALKEAHAAFSQERSALQQEAQRAAEKSVEAEQARQSMENKLESLDAQIKGLLDVRSALTARIDTSEAARAQAEKMASTAREEAAAGRAALESALAHAKDEIETAVSRLEGTERRAKMQVEEVRQSAAKQVESVRLELKSKTDAYTIETARLQARTRELQGEISHLKEENVRLSTLLETIREASKKDEAKKGTSSRYGNLSRRLKSGSKKRSSSAEKRAPFGAAKRLKS